MNRKQLDILVDYIDAKVHRSTRTSDVQKQLYKTVEEDQSQVSLQSTEPPFFAYDPKVSEKTQESLQHIHHKLRDINIRLDLLSEQYRDLNNWLKERFHIGK